MLKNCSIYLLADYRMKNYKPKINEILLDAIKKKKEQKKAEKLKIMDLLKYEHPSNNENIIIPDLI